MPQHPKLLETLRCPQCQGRFSLGEGSLEESLVCNRCGQEFPIIDGIPRLLLSPFREALLHHQLVEHQEVKTALKFGLEWKRFPEMYDVWERQFLEYMDPHPREFFAGKKVLDAGCGNGRFAFYAAKFGAEVWAIDLGPAVEVARRNTEWQPNVRVIQADLHDPPFAFESFDFIYSLGVLHHLPDPEPAFRNLLRYLKPGGEVHIYVYWKPEHQPIKAALLAMVAGLRQITTRLPERTVLALSYIAAVLTHVFLVWPYKLLKEIPGLRSIATRMPMKQYARLPFRVCVNDQVDRFSAPIENRYAKQEVVGWCERAGLLHFSVHDCFGWVATGQKPSST